MIRLKTAVTAAYDTPSVCLHETRETPSIVRYEVDSLAFCINPLFLRLFLMNFGASEYLRQQRVL